MIYGQTSRTTAACMHRAKVVAELPDSRLEQNAPKQAVKACCIASANRETAPVFCLTSMKRYNLFPTNIL